MLRRLFIAACLSLVTLPALAQGGALDFTAKDPITLDVASIDVESEYVAPMREPNVDHLITITPSDAVRLWASQRLKAGGTQGRARVIIRDASVKEKELARTTGIKGWFTKDQSEQYDGRLQVDIIVEGTARGFSGSVSAIVTRSTSVREDVSLAERDKTMLAMVTEMGTDLDSQLEAAIKANLFPVIIIQ
ncbi:hypothetical protein GE253_01850 [Niveispirillum sp. SYP-B3756]|uniref:hypothetical protein n=1 Tax=Niveispirillum sp. SYP-B3756 TaxID=2662178 RepID=UPI0012909113|nr:hypothetical protein [Niveispirillum sp. SYP-B3756]MQP64079.1 hypothetical protein [Niveispirillum sp. SYP-B3756]